MRFKSQGQQARSLTVNLVPMMDVLMTVLTFFIIISMTLTGQRILNVSLPQISAGAQTRDGDTVANDLLMIGLDNEGQIILDQQPVSREDMAQAMRAYLSTQPDGLVVLKADRQLPYDQVVELLKFMQEIGGSQVSLAVDQQ